MKYLVVRLDGYYGFGDTPSEAAVNAKMKRTYVGGYLCYADPNFVKGELEVTDLGGIRWFLNDAALEASKGKPWLADLFAQSIVLQRGEMRLVQGQLEIKSRP